MAKTLTPTDLHRVCPAVRRLHNDLDPISHQFPDMRGGQWCPPLPDAGILTSYGKDPLYSISSMSAYKVVGHLALGLVQGAAACSPHA